MDIIEIAGLLLLLMMVLLGGGVWIAMTLAIVGWIGMAFFTGTPPGRNLFTAFWSSSSSWTLAALPMFI
ncbi:MAG TPA: C4-dicarboxylate ABC transporter permease, partial [Burkholderiales bacterium]|nr:C4-dicarboxylate ABC transporter permease [Burkholderiales bacterium]